jgi:hypothetical protein
VKNHGSAILAPVVGLLLSCGDSTSPAPSLDGVWGGLVNLPATTDSLTLALGEQDGQIRGFAMQRPLDAPRYTRIYSVGGSTTGRSIELNLHDGTFASLVLRGTLSGSVLSATLVMSAMDEPITLRRSAARGDGVAGTWGLASTSGPTEVLRDTIAILPDGRARRHREHQNSSYGTLAIWSRRGDWLVLEQYAPPSSGSGIPFLDSLRIQSNSLVRTTTLFDGSTVTETYTRAPQP